MAKKLEALFILNSASFYNKKSPHENVMTTARPGILLF